MENAGENGTRRIIGFRFRPVAPRFAASLNRCLVVSFGLSPALVPPPQLQAMSKERFTERQADVRESANRLAEAVAQPETALIRDATIQRFEFT